MERYRVLKKADEQELRELHEKIKESRWREKFHIQTVTGLMNDPNGFSFYNNRWHLFYQWFPFWSIHGLKHWYHVSSEDLIHWKNEGVGLIPDTFYDNKGCYSGSGIVKDDQLYLVYTGNHKNENNERHPYQMLAVMDESSTIKKKETPIIDMHENYTEHQRDPKIFYRKEDGYYYILLGAQRKDETGTLLLYRSENIEDDWSFYGELTVEGYPSFGYMAECPDLERIDEDTWLLLFSPQGLEAEGDRYQNKFNNTYFIGSMDFEKLTFTPTSEMQELDLGFDFYAAQCASQNVYENQAVLIGWFGCSDYTYPPTDKEGWSCLQTLPRILSVEDNVLKQRPVKDWKELCGDVLFEAVRSDIKKDFLKGKMPDGCVMEVNNPDLESLTFALFASMNTDGFTISFDKETGYFSIDKSGMADPCNEEFGLERRVHLSNGLKRMLVFVDRSSVEIFLNDGEYVFSSRVFPEETENLLRLGGRNVTVTIYDVNTTVVDDFVI